MRNIYLSFLGTSDYLPCNYEAAGLPTVGNVRFVQEATITWFCSGWSSDDRIVIFTTEESSAKNWLDDGHTDREGKRLSRTGLAARLRSMALEPPVDQVRISSGRNEQEIMDIFETMYGVLMPGDTLYMDITHAFRSLPLLAIVVLNYAKAMKDIRIGAIGYGAMEALGAPHEVRAMELEERNVPVFDLLPYDRILEWSTSIDRFLSAGDAQGIARLANQEVTPVLARTRGRDEEAAAVRRLAKCLDEFSRVITTCRGKSITASAFGLRRAISGALDQETVRPLRPLLERLQESTENFRGERIGDGLAAARWCLEHNLIQQGFTILEETIFTWILTRATDLSPEEERNRTLVNQAVAITIDAIPPDRWKREARENRETVSQLVSWLTPREELLKNMRNLAQDRNDINHAGMKNGPMPPDKFGGRLAGYLDFFSELVENQGVIQL